MSHAAAASPWQQRGGREGGGSLSDAEPEEFSRSDRHRTRSEQQQSQRLLQAADVTAGSGSDPSRSGGSQGKLGNSSWKQSVH